MAESSSGVKPEEISSKTQVPHKTFDDFMEFIIVRQSGKDMPKATSPAKRRKAIDAILNDPQVRHRFVFSSWPRPPAAPNWRNEETKTLNPRPYACIKPENSQLGKMAPNGIQLWGATLLDFFYVLRLPDIKNLRTTSTGSKLLQWCKENGEYNVGENAVARMCIRRAEMEKSPELIPVYDIEVLIKNLEESATSEIPPSERDSKIPKPVDESDESMDQTGDDTARHDCTDNVPSEIEESDARKVETYNENEGVELPALPVSPKSVFDKGALPEIWKETQPFSNTGPWNFQSLPVLEEYIAQSRLPRKLVVHDPWNVLMMQNLSSPTESSVSKHTMWEERVAENIYTYNLQLSEECTERREDDEKEILEKEKERQQILDDFLSDPHSLRKRPPGLEIPYVGDVFGLKPAIYVIFPPAPRLASPNEAHLHLDPNELIGTGHHSAVYLAELETQRSFLVREQLCINCVMEDVQAILREEDGENGERRDPKWDEPSGEIVLEYVNIPPYTMTVDTPIPSQDPDNTYVIEEGEKYSYLSYRGPYRVIQAHVGYQNPERAPYCEHFAADPKALHPLTAKVRVAAKLSVEGDSHLAAEAVNYEKFPKHFFEHWSGYNIIPPIHDPTPVGPLVPQFYGYYVPETNNERHAGIGEDEEVPNYLSPILLLEHCGVPISEHSLSIDDRHECAALCFRMHEAAWLHGSIYQRNILRKPGPISVAPDERIKESQKRGGYGKNWSYRLIDFGRSKQAEVEGIDKELEMEYHRLKGRISVIANRFFD